jgi:hypothetical protein
MRLFLLSIVFGLTASFARDLPTVPVGLDAYRQWDLWPQQRIGVRAYMRSTYDRRGGNEGADASHFLYQIADDFNVTLDVAGPGILYFTRYNHWHGSPWHYVVDGKDNLLQETSTATPEHPVANSTFLPDKALPNPLTWTWSQTKGADLSWLPIPFEHSFQMAYSRTHYGTGYYIYHQFVEGIPLSHSIRSWGIDARPDNAVLKLISDGPSDLLSEIPVAASGTWKLNPTLPEPIELTGPGIIRSIEFSVPREHATDFGRFGLRIRWDGRGPSVDAPLALFFGAGTLYNRDNREYLVKAFPVKIRFDAERVYFSCYFPMPFFKSAELQLLVPAPGIPNFDIQYRIRCSPCKTPPNCLAYFHATYADLPNPEPGHDLVLLDTRKAEGDGDWSGHFIGISWIFSDRANLSTLEGDPRFFFDDSLTPQAQGTGTEEWGGGGDYWGGSTMTLPFAGHPVGARNEKEARNDEDKIESAYRFLLGDLMPFGRNAVIQLEHGGENQSTEHYQSVTYWYGLPCPSLLQTDELKIADPASEAEHQYHSPSASDPYEITSRYEWGVDILKGKEIYPAQTDNGRKMTGTSEFTLKLDPKNVGVLLRRKLDYQFPNQRAEIFVSDAGTKAPVWHKAGVWYLAGANTCVYSNPKGELGATEHHIQTSNRRFRDDEFLIPRKLTEGRKAIRVRVVFTPVHRPLFTGQAVPELAWSEIKYTAYCFVVPDFKP